MKIDCYTALFFISFDLNQAVKFLSPSINIIPRTTDTPLFCCFALLRNRRIPSICTFIEIVYSVYSSSLSCLETITTDLTLLLVALVRKKLKFITNFLIGHSFGILGFCFVIPANFRKLVVRETTSAGCIFIHIHTTQHTNDSCSKSGRPCFITITRKFNTIDRQ